jgi:hypothetical protein
MGVTKPLNPNDFSFFVLPLGILVVALVGAVYYFAHKEEIARNRTKKLINAYIREKAKQQEMTRKELANLQRLYESKAIDDETYERLKRVLLVMHEKKSVETMSLLDFVKKKRKI